MSIAGEVAELSFRQVANGWVYRAPNPWIFGDKLHYLVRDDQKARIVAVLTTPRLGLLSLVSILGQLVSAVIVLVVRLKFSVSLGWTNNAWDAFTFVAIAFPSFVMIPTYISWQLRRLKPILAGAPRTDERISDADMYRAMSTRSLLFVAGATSFVALASYGIWSGGSGRLFGDVGLILILIGGATCGLSTLWFLWLAVRNVWQKREPV